MRILEAVKGRHIIGRPRHPWMYSTKEEVEDFMQKHRIHGMVDPRDLTIHPTDDSISLPMWSKDEGYLVNYKGKLRLPVQFHIAGSLAVNDKKIQTWDGLPPVVINKLDMRNTDISSFKGAPRVIGELVGSSRRMIKDFSGLENTSVKAVTWYSTDSGHVRSVRGLPDTIKEMVLSVENIGGIERECPHLEYLVVLSVRKPVQMAGWLSLLRLPESTNVEFATAGLLNYQAAVQILKKHLERRDLLACQEELIDAGLDSFASF